MTSAAATDSKAIATASPFDFDKAIVQLQKNEGASLTDILAELAVIPTAAPPAEKKKASKETVARNNEEAIKAISALPEVFGTVKAPASRRRFSQAELAKVLTEKNALAEAKKAVTKRESDLNEWVSRHFDVYAEELGLVDPETTPKDAKGHYLIGSAGNRLEQAVEGAEKMLTREKENDKTSMSHDLLLAAYEDGKISRTEYLAYTSNIRVLDEKKVSTALLSKARQERTKEIIEMVTQIQPGKLSIRVR